MLSNEVDSLRAEIEEKDDEITKLNEQILLMDN